MDKMVTIKDVAKTAGMSVATVSGALNGKAGYAKKTVERVWEIANALNYVPNASARTLQKGKNSPRQKTRIIMFMIHMGRIVPEHTRDMESAVFRMAWEAQKKNLFIIPYLYHDLSLFQCPPLLNGYVDGAILMTPHPEVVRIVSAKVPTILIDAPFDLAHSTTPMINVDWKYGCRLFIEELRKLGHRSAVYLQSSLNINTFTMGNVTVPAFRYAAEEMAFPLDEEYSFKADFNPKNNISLLRQYLPRLKDGIRKGRVTALFAPDICYLEMLQNILKEENIRCPGEFSMGAPRVQVYAPENICSIYMDRMQLMTTALGKLINMLEGREEVVAETLLRPVLLKNATLAEVCTSTEI